MSVIVNVELLKNLRETSGAGMSACRDALIISENDIVKAMKVLREKGIAQASKKSDREVKEGACGVLSSQNYATLIKIGCETDFVVRNDKFQSMVSDILHQVHLSNVLNLEDAKCLKLASGNTVADEISANIGIVGENMVFANFQKITCQNGIVVSYIHSKICNNFGKIAVALSIESSGDKEKLEECGKQICMHIAAFNPTFLSSDDVSVEFIQNERDIYTNQLKDSGKSDAIIEKIVDGKLQKTLQDQVLLEQNFAIDSSIKVKDFILKIAKDIGSEIKISSFIRLSI